MRIRAVLILAAGLAMALAPDAVAQEIAGQEASGQEAGGLPDAVVPAPPEPQPVLPALPALPPGEGPEGWYYLAKRIETGAKATQGVTASTPLPEIPETERKAVLDAMYLLAFRFGERTAARESGRDAFRRAAESQDMGLASRLGYEWMDYFGPDWRIQRALFDMYLAAGMHSEAQATLAAIRSTLASAAKANASEMSWLGASLKRALGDPSWMADASASLRASSLDKWSALGLGALASEPSASEDDRKLAAMRVAYFGRNFSAAKDAALALRDTILAPAAPRWWVSEAGRSFVNAGAGAEGAAWFAAAFTGEDGAVPSPLFAGSAKVPENRWVAAFWYARTLAASDRKSDAAILYLELTDKSPNAQDSDSALWFWLEIAMEQAAAQDFDDSIQPAEQLPEAGGAAGLSTPLNSLELAILAEASLRWKSPSYFDDILTSYLRRLLVEKSWNEAVALALLVGPKASASMGTRLDYTAARLLETGRASGQEAGIFFAKVLARPGAEEYYRSLASWRTGAEPPFLSALPGAFAAPSVVTAPAATSPSAVAAPAAISETDIINEYLEHDLDSLASSRALSALGSAPAESVAALAREMSAEGLHHAALRLARDALNRGGKTADPELYRLVYPVAWRETVGALSAKLDIPEPLLYGIVRSESVFDPNATSTSGARGLSQLMPSTATETAKGLGMKDFSIVDPADNLKIGMNYYSYMYRRFGARPMRAMFAYNAGPSRMAKWNTESGDLPDDLLLETLHLSETRQYGRNIVQATLAYGKIHYGIAPATMLEFLVEGKPLPAPTAPPVPTDTVQATQSEPVPATQTEPVPAAPAANGYLREAL